MLTLLRVDIDSHCSLHSLSSGHVEPVVNLKMSLSLRLPGFVRLGGALCHPIALSWALQCWLVTGVEARLPLLLRGQFQRTGSACSGLPCARSSQDSERVAVQVVRCSLTAEKGNRVT